MAGVSIKSQLTLFVTLFMNESPPSNQNLPSNLYCDCIYIFIEILYFFVRQSHIRVELNEVQVLTSANNGWSRK